MQVGGSQRVLVLVDHMHVDCSLLPQGVLHLVLHILGNGRLEDHVVTIHNHHYHRHHHHHENRCLVDRVVGVDGSGEDALAVSMGNLGTTKKFIKT